ncbi:MAG: hypothetical protein HC855_03965 [Rhizobiales bacterium]|nr:hypothetical protein [Hyphomicrobiales bacterium]
MSEQTLDALARRIYAEFNAKPESRYIAAEFALIQLSRLVGRIKPRNVLEIGAGIGTITKLLLEHPNRPAEITASENHPVCLRELDANLKGIGTAGLKLIRNASELDMNMSFDLVIFDGSLNNERQFGIFREGTWCFVEGSRSQTVRELQLALVSRGLNLDYKTERPGGTKIRFLSARRVLGFRLPAFKVKPLKGCSIGQVVSAT